MYDNVRTTLEINAKGLICFKFVKIKNSPSNLEESQKEYDLICELVKETLSKFSDKKSQNLFALQTELEQAMAEVKDDFLRIYINSIIRSVKTYNDHFKESKKRFK